MARRHSHRARSQFLGLSRSRCAKDPARAVRGGVVVAHQDDHRAPAVGQIPQARQRDRRRLHDQVGEQALQLVRHRHVRMGQIHEVGKEQVVRAQRRRAVAVLVDPERVALPRQHHRLGQVEAEAGDVPLSERGQRHRRPRPVQRPGQVLGPARGKEVERAVDLQRPARETRA